MKSPDFSGSIGTLLLALLASAVLCCGQAKQMYMQLLQSLRDNYKPDKIAEGSFGAMMQVSLVNDVRLSAMLVLPEAC